MTTANQMGRKPGKTKLAACIEQVRKSGESFRSQVHTACIALALHTFHYGDWRGANQLIEALGAGIKQGQVVNWIGRYVYLEVDAEKGEFVGFKKGKGKDNIAETFQDAKANPFYKAEAERMAKDKEEGRGPIAPDVLLDKAINAVLDRLEKNAKEWTTRAPKEAEKHVHWDLSDKTVERLFSAAAYQMDKEVIDTQDREGHVIHLEAKKGKAKDKAA